MTLVDVLLAQANVARRVIEERALEERRVDMAQTLLYMQEKLRVYWQLPRERCTRLSITLRLKFELLHKLQQALQEYNRAYPANPATSSKLTNATVVLSTLRGPDPLGRILLHMDDTPQQWAEVLARYRSLYLSLVHASCFVFQL